MLPLAKKFKVQITSVCSDLIVVKPVIEDMKLNLELGIAARTQSYLQFTENQNKFCGHLVNTFSNLTGKIDLLEHDPTALNFKINT
jgi:hypothetical protein